MCSTSHATCKCPLQVYNITHYLRFHPGGVPLLLKIAGKDGTALFNKYHAWVSGWAALRGVSGRAALRWVSGWAVPG